MVEAEGVTQSVTFHPGILVHCNAAHGREAHKGERENGCYNNDKDSVGQRYGGKD